MITNIERAYAECLTMCDPSIDQNRNKLPSIPEADFQSLCANAMAIFENEPMTLHLEGRFIIAGDLHGHVFDLVRLFREEGTPPNTSYLFLGDFVDRGPFSLEVVLFLFMFKVRYPKSIYLIRGNHEFKCINSNTNFATDLVKMYGSSNLLDPINDAFSYLPIAAVINNRVFAVHGGIGPHIDTVKQLESIARPLNTLYGGISDALLWSDPSDDIDIFQQSTRGAGYFFGARATKDFLKRNHLKMIVRGHQVVQDGVHFMFDKTLATVFTASNYCNEMNNVSGVLIVDETTETMQIYEPIPFVNRADVIQEIKRPDPLGGASSLTDFRTAPRRMTLTPRKNPLSRGMKSRAAFS